jgi:hypothetical protein
VDAHMLATPTGGLLPPARLLLPCAIRGEAQQFGTTLVQGSARRVPGTRRGLGREGVIGAAALGGLQGPGCTPQRP